MILQHIEKEIAETFVFIVLFQDISSYQFVVQTFLNPCLQELMF